jgi:hypothetical protein
MTRTISMLCVVALLGACSTTKLVEHWQDENFSRGDLDDVLVAAITANVTNRLLFEAEFERILERDGVKGLTSVQAFGEVLPEREQVEAWIKTHDIAYVVATRLENVTVDKQYVPPQIRTYYTGPYYPSLGNYWGGDVITFTKEGFTDERRTVMLVTTIFDTRTGVPVWVGRSSSFEPDSVFNLAGEIARATWAAIDP